MNGVSLGDVDLEMYMVFGEAEFAELKPKAFEVRERLGAGVDVTLFFKVSVSVVGGKHHSDPVIASVTQNLFRAYATFIYQIFHASCRTFIRYTLVVYRVRQDTIFFIG